MTIFDLEKLIKEMIDELKGLCADSGLSNQAGEETVITNVFLYKFLNDRFMFNLNKFAENNSITIEDIIKNENDELFMFYDSYPDEIAFTYDDTIECLAKKAGDPNFYMLFDKALERINNYKKNEAFLIETDDGTKLPLFTKISDVITDSSKKTTFTKALFGIITSGKFDFSDAFINKFDFYSTIFEYLIKDYNVASGKYAEYFTPQAVSNIIGKILVKMNTVDPDKLYEIYDPSAGSGSLVLHLANELGYDKSGNKKAVIYTQDISNKSTRFLRINMILNGLKKDLKNVIEGNTLLHPAHFTSKENGTEGLKQFDFITSNPPFKMDFSSSRDSIEKAWEGTDRFFAGIPEIPSTKKESMGIYLCFIQHILYSLKENGKAAIVVPTGFLTAAKRSSKIAYFIREKMINEKMLRGVISMPSNIFANTGTNVSILFIDKSKTYDKAGNEIERKVLLMDASNLGTKVKDGKNQRTILSKDEENKIINTFINNEVVEDFSVLVSNDEIKKKNFSFSAGQYFKVKIEYVDISQEKYDKMIEDFNNDFATYVAETLEFQKSIKEQLERLKVIENKEE